jgi:hypothetical protein
METWPPDNLCLSLSLCPMSLRRKSFAFDKMRAQITRNPHPKRPYFLNIRSILTTILFQNLPPTPSPINNTNQILGL